MNTLDRTVHEVFRSVAARVPGLIALRGDGAAMTYAELDQRSDLISAVLRARGIVAGAHVGLYAQRSANTVAAMLGILKAGAAYVPFDPSYPAKLLRFMYEDCAPALMLTQPARLGDGAEVRFWDGETLDVDGEFAAASAAASAGVAVGRDALAYIMYTSGSTGHPKGVRVPHRGIVRLVIDSHFAVMDEHQVHLQLAPLAFDASTFEIWGALLNGGTLAIQSAQFPSLDDVAESIRRDGVTTLWLTAGLFHLMVDHRLDGLAPLRQLLAGGDVLSPPHVVRALHALPGCQLINGYGPTENTTFTCCHPIPRDYRGDGPVPIGRPIAHTSAYVLDSAGQPVPDGEPGELYAGGDGVALGYLNRPDLTAERFLPDPFATRAGSLMYRTGDRVRRRGDGVIEFLGRADRQVKINGKRVELDEIEASIRRSGLVEDVAVTAPPAGAGARKVFAYVKANGNPAAVVTDLRSFLKAEVPEYMVPSLITVLESLPLTPTGKVDRARLPAPADLPAAPTVAPKPGSEIEASLLAIWRDVLATGAIGLDDNFFDLGGTSLQLIQVHARIRQDMHTEIGIVDLFRFPRISALAAWLARRAGGSVGDASAKVLSAQDRARRQQAALARARPARTAGKP